MIHTCTCHLCTGGVGGQGLLHNMSSQGKGGGGTLIYNLMHNVDGWTGEGRGPFLGGYYVYGGGAHITHPYYTGTQSQLLSDKQYILLFYAIIHFAILSCSCNDSASNRSTSSTAAVITAFVTDVHVNGPAVVLACFFLNSATPVVCLHGYFGYHSEHLGIGLAECQMLSI